MVWALAAVYIVLAAEAAHIGALVKRYHRVLARTVTLLTARDQLLTGLAAQLSKPVTFLARARAIDILGHVRERVVADIALAVTLLDATDFLLDYLKEVTLTLCALVTTGALETPLDVAALALVILQVVAIDALSAAKVAALALHAVSELLARLDLSVPVKVESKGLFNAARLAKLGD